MFATLELLAKKRRELDAAEAAWLKDVVEYDRSGDCVIDDFGSAAIALRHACNLDAGVAHGYVTLARKLEQLPVVAAAFAAGDISQRHAQVVADANTAARADSIANIESDLVELAFEYPPREFGRFVRRFTDAIDGDGGAGEDDRDFDRRALYTAKTFKGTFDIRGNADQFSGECIDAALNAEMERDLQKQDPRSKPQRRLDALNAICRLYLEQQNTSESHGVRPHVNVVANLDELPSASGVRAPTMVGRNHFSAAMLELISCDCEISRIIMQGRSEVLDVGRATNTATAAQWKALVARDVHCQHPGCDRPPSHCEAHHLRHWAHGGRTDLDNLVLLCWLHHRELHVEEAKARGRETRTHNRDARTRGP